MRVLNLFMVSLAVCSLTGCRLFERWTRDSDRDRDRAIGNPTSRTRDRDDLRDREGDDPNSPPRNWLDTPVSPRNRNSSTGRDGFGSGIVADPVRGGSRSPGGSSDRRDDDRDSRNVSQRIISGILEDESGKRVADGYVSIEPYPPSGSGARIGVKTDEYGYFLFPGLKSGQTYVLSAEFKVGGRPMAGRQYVKVPNQTVRLMVREDLTLAPIRPDGEASAKNDLPAGIPSTGAVRVPSLFDSAPAMNTNTPSVSQPTGDLPFPNENTNTGQPWSPIGPPPARPATSRPELFAPNGKDWNGSPPVNIPGPAALPPPNLNGSTSRLEKSNPGIQLVSAAGQTRTFATGNRSDLILLDFMTTNCLPCKRIVPRLKSLQQRHDAMGFEIVGIVCDPDPPQRRQELASAYQDQMRLNYGLYFDPPGAGSLQSRYKVDRYPTLILLDGTGRILFRGGPAELSQLEQLLFEMASSQ